MQIEIRWDLIKFTFQKEFGLGISVLDLVGTSVIDNWQWFSGLFNGRTAVALSETKLTTTHQFCKCKKSPLVAY